MNFQGKTISCHGIGESIPSEHENKKGLSNTQFSKTGDGENRHFLSINLGLPSDLNEYVLLIRNSQSLLLPLPNFFS